MRFFPRRRKEKKERAEQAESFDLGTWFQERLDAAEMAAGADEKLLKLAEIKEDLDDRLKEKVAEISGKAGKKQVTAYLGSLAATGGLVASATVLTGGAIIPFVLIPGVIGSDFVATGVKRMTKNRLEKQTAEFIGEIKAQKDIITQMENKLLETSIQVIAKSPLRESIFDRFPDLKSRFAEAAARKIAMDEAKPEASPPKRKSIFDRFPGR